MCVYMFACIQFKAQAINRIFGKTLSTNSITAELHDYKKLSSHRNQPQVLKPCQMISSALGNYTVSD